MVVVFSITVLVVYFGLYRQSQENDFTRLGSEIPHSLYTKVYLSLLPFSHKMDANLGLLLIGSLTE